MGTDLPQKGSSAPFKVVSYNIRKCFGTDRRRDPMRILNVLEDVDADIVVLQEADRRFGTRQSALPHFLIEKHTDYRPVPFDVQLDSMGWHGNAILVRSNISIDHHDIIHIPYLEPRGVVSAMLTISGQRLAIFGMHLDLSGLWRLRQARAIVKLTQRLDDDCPVLLMGDLNEWRQNGGCHKEFGRHFTVLDCGRSFHSMRPIGKLDRIMHSHHLRSIDHGVHQNALASRASDHLPVWAKFVALGDGCLQ